MCGIIFACRPLASWNEPSGVWLGLVRDRFRRIAHRGPDHSGEKVTPTFFIGCHRLAIVNLGVTGNQPLAHGGCVLVCNGQIYNASCLVNSKDDLRSDVDVILRAHVDGTFASIDALALALDGDFAFVLIDSRHGRDVVYVGRDPVGVRPLFYGANASGRLVAFASEAKALQGLPGVDAVAVFPPGHVYDSESGTLRRYTDIYRKVEDGTEKTGEEKEMTFDEAADAVRASLTAAVVKRVENSDRPIAFLCSGGLDSSIVLSLAHAHLTSVGRERDMHAFSVQFGEDSADAMYAGMLCQRLGVRHTVVSFDWGDVERNLFGITRQIESFDPCSVRTAVPAFLLAKFIRTQTDYKVILSGEGADEVFMGYTAFARAPDGTVANTESARIVRDLHMFDMLRADRCFAAWGLELRVPFLDIDVLRTAFAIPGRHRMFQNGVEKALLRHAFRDDQDLVAARVLDRQKERFSDGCGFGYVPALLTRLAPPNTFDLAAKEASERWVYRTWFDACYPGFHDLIGGRLTSEASAAATQEGGFLGEST